MRISGMSTEHGRRRSCRWVTVCVLSVSLAAVTVAGPVHAGPRLLAPASEAPPKAAVRLQQDGDRAYEEKDYARAREAWIGAYSALSSDVAMVAYRSTLLTLIHDATLQAHDQAPSAEPLRVVIGLYETFLERYLPAGSSSGAQFEADLTKLRALVPVAPAAPEPVALLLPENEPVANEPAASESAASEPAAPADPAPADTRRPSHRHVPFLAAGSLVLAGGIAAVVAGSLFRPLAKNQVSKFDDPVEREDAFVDSEAKKGALWIGGGAAVAATGLALVIVGAVLHSRNKRRTVDRGVTRIVPWLAHPGIVWTGSF